MASLLAVNSTHSHQRQSSNDILSCTSHIWSSHTKYSSSSLASGTGARNPAHHLLVDRKWSNYKIKSDFTGNFCGKHVGLLGSDEDGGRNFHYQSVCGEHRNTYITAVVETRRHSWRESEMELCTTGILLNWRSLNEGAKAHFERNKKPFSCHRNQRIWVFESVE